MSDKIINFNDERNKRLKKENEISRLTYEDIFNLLLISKNYEGILTSFNLNLVQQAFARYKHMQRFSSIFSNLEIEYNEDGKEIINFSSIVEKKSKDNIIIFYNDDVVILADEEYFNNLKMNYTEETYFKFNDLVFFLNNDLKYGFDNWELLFEDEYIKYPGYPGIVTGEFIGQKKDAKVMKKVKERTIERLKNYNK